MQPVDQRVRREVAKSALRKLATGRAVPRTELFPTTKLCGPTVNAHKVWSQRIAGKLVDQGIVERLGQGTATSYRLVEGDDAATRLQELSTDIEALSHFVFGGGVVAHVPQISDAELSGDELVEGEDPRTVPGEGTSAEEIEEPGSDESISVRLEFALKMLAAILENIIYVREQQREQGEQIKGLEEAFR